MRIHIVSVIALVAFFAAFGFPSRTPATPATNSAPVDLSCHGPAHKQAIELWESGINNYVAKLINIDLNEHGDVYSLYNTEEYLQSFVEMTRRCKDKQQIAELSHTLSAAFKSLKPLPFTNTRGWICTGGPTCTLANHLLGSEVQLCSAQFLGLLGAVATDILEVVPPVQRTADEKAFLNNTAATIATQLNHWYTTDYFASIASRARMTSADAKDGRSAYFFTDKDLWLLTALSDLSELQAGGIQFNGDSAQAFKYLKEKSEKIADVFNLFLARTSLFSAPDGQRAEIDRGYWRNYADSKYALYIGTTPPATCKAGDSGGMQKTITIESNSSYIDPNLGWDFSHARRLVPALSTFTRNQGNLAAVFGYKSGAFDPSALQESFANQIVSRIWNKDDQFPLFSNFWDGSNGWYRVGYNNGTGDCRQGEAPYSLAWSFPTGGYPRWGAFNATIRALNVRLYQLFNATDVKSKAFVAKYYPQLQIPSDPNGASPNTLDIWMLSVLSSLVDN